MISKLLRAKARVVEQTLRFSSCKQEENLHSSQQKTLTQQLMLVNYQDDIVGHIDKKKAHLNSYIFSKDAKPHRAFSIFLFNDKNQLLLHRRSLIKITFPNYWTNTCCSHPLDTPDERDQHEGTKLAAQRRLNFEFNIKFDSLNELKLVDKLLYKSASDETWGEYELDYVFFLRKNVIDISPNPEEIVEYAWVERKDLKDFLREKESKGQMSTPWFKKIIDNRLEQWWISMERGTIQDKKFSIEDNKHIPFF